MKDVKWLIEKYEDSNFINGLIDTVKANRFHYKVIDIFNFQYKISSSSFFHNDSCVVFYGGLLLAKILQREKQWVPGPICNFQNLECLTYFSYFGKYLLNQDYIMMPLNEFYRKKDDIYNKFSIDNKVFLRPNSGAKTFCGNIYDYDFLDSEINTIRLYGKLPIDRILSVISSPKKIDKEWRIVIVDRKVVAYSLYKKDGEIFEKRECDEGAIELSKAIANEKWQPDYAYTVDICLSNGYYKLLEVNSFSCSGLYECDPNLIVESVSDCAIKEWKDYIKIQ